MLALERVPIIIIINSITITLHPIYLAIPPHLDYPSPEVSPTVLKHPILMFSLKSQKYLIELANTCLI